MKAAATAFNVYARIAARWIRRYQLEGSAGLQDRSSRPHSLSTAYGEALARRVGARLHGFHIAQITGLSCATVSRILLRLGLNRMRDLEPAVPLIRYGMLLRAICFTSILSSWDASLTSLFVPMDTAEASCTADGSMFMSLSMTIPASPSPRSCPTSRLLPLSPLARIGCLLRQPRNPHS